MSDSTTIATEWGECELPRANIHNVLVRAPFEEEIDDALCSELLTVEDPSRENVLSVTLTQSPDDRLDTWNRHVETMPSEAVLITTDDRERSTNVERITSSEGIDSNRLTIESIADPGNLTRLGVSITDALEGWDDPTNRTVICVHSLTALLQYCELEVAFQFLDTLTSHVRAKNALAHYHIDPTAHNQQAYSTIRLLFDAIITAEDGDLTLNTR